MKLAEFDHAEFETSDSMNDYVMIMEDDITIGVGAICHPLHPINAAPKISNTIFQTTTCGTVNILNLHHQTSKS